MGKPSKELFAFMEKHGIESDEVWEVRAGGAWAVKHSALERVAAEKKITFGPPNIVEVRTADRIVVIYVTGTMGERSEWSFGEASPANCKNAYPASMAEKRAKDRVILKLLNTHGELYSEDEADDFKRQNPHVTRPSDIVPPTDYDEHGEVIDNIPHGEPSGKKLRVVDQRPIFAALQKEARAFTDSKAFLAWMASDTTIARVADIKPDWQETFRGLCKEHLQELRKQERGDDMRMAG